MDLTTFLQVGIYVLTVIAGILAYKLGFQNGYKKAYAKLALAKNEMTKKPIAYNLQQALLESGNDILLAQYNQAIKQFNLGLIDFQTFNDIKQRIGNELEATYKG